MFVFDFGVLSCSLSLLHEVVYPSKKPMIPQWNYVLSMKVYQHRNTNTSPRRILELLAELIMGGNIGTRKVHEPLQVFRKSFYICTVLSTLSHIKHRQHGQNKIKIDQVITWSRSRNSNSPGYWHCFRIGSWCIRRGTN